MPRMKLSRRQQRPPFRGPAVRARAPEVAAWEGRAMAGVGRAISGLGGVFGDLALRLQRSAIRESLADAKEDFDLKADELIKTTEIDEPNTLLWADQVQKKLPGVRNSVKPSLTVPAVMKRFETYVNKRQTEIIASAGIRGWRIHAQQATSDTTLRRRMLNSIKRGDPEEFRKHIDALAADGMFRGDKKMIAETVTFWKNLTGETIASLQKQGKLDQAKSAIEGRMVDLAISDGWQEAIAWLTKPKNVKEIAKQFGVSLSDIDGILEDLRTHAQLEDVKQREELEKVQERERTTIYDKINDKSIVRDDIEATSLDAKERQSLWELAQRVAKEPHILEQSDPVVEREISDAIAFHPRSIDSKYIRGFVGKGKEGGLSLAKAENYEAKLLKALDTTSSINAPVARRYLTMLKEAETDRIFSMDSVENSIVYGKTLNALIEHFDQFREQKKRDPEPEEVQEFYESLLESYRKPESPFTEARVQQTLGELESGGASDIFGFVIKFRKGEDAINHILRALGPDWQRISPQAVEIIKRKWPEAKVKVRAVKLEKRETFKVGERRVHPNGGLYEYTGEAGSKAWKLVKE